MDEEYVFLFGKELYDSLQVSINNQTMKIKTDDVLGNQWLTGPSLVDYVTSLGIDDGVQLSTGMVRIDTIESVSAMVTEDNDDAILVTTTSTSIIFICEYNDFCELMFACDRPRFDHETLAQKMRNALNDDNPEDASMP